VSANIPRGGYSSRFIDHASTGASSTFSSKTQLLTHLHTLRSQSAQRLRKRVVREVFEEEWVNRQAARFDMALDSRSEQSQAEASEMERVAASYAARAKAELPPASQAAINPFWRTRGVTTAAAAAAAADAAAAEQPGHARTVAVDNRAAGAAADRRGGRDRGWQSTEQHRSRGWEARREYEGDDY